jgi:hypothetical protein
MLKKLTASLRQNTWLMLTAFAAFVAASVVGHFTVDAGSATPAIWLAIMWAMLATGVIVWIAVILEAVIALNE